MIIFKKTKEDLEKLISKLEYDEKYEIKNEEGLVIHFKKGKNEYILFYNNENKLVYFQTLSFELKSKL